MIFVTTGTQLPFDRLVRAVDQWAAENPGHEIFAQIGSGKYQPANMTFVEKLDPNEYKHHFDRSELVISHAGMGTIISGLENAKRLVLMPRRATLGEHRNDHQLGTAAKFGHHALIDIVENETEIGAKISESLSNNNSVSEGTVKLEPSPELIRRVRDFINGC